MRDLRLLYPLLFAVLPVLHLAANNDPGAYTMREVAVAAAVVVAGAGALYALMLLLLRRRWPVERIALVMMAAVIWFWVYRKAVRSAGGVLEPGMAHLAVALGGLAATAALLWWLFRRPRAPDRLATFLALMGGILVAWSSVGIGAHQIRNYRALRSNPIIGELARPVAPPAPPARHAAAGPRRDIYLIVLDEYGHSSTLRDYYGFDNRPFEDSLRQLGFAVPAAVRSNYSYTWYSLPSLLNFTLLRGMRGNKTHVPHHLLRHSRAAAFLKSRGYRFVFVPSQWWVATDHQPTADAEVPVWRRVGFDRGVTTANLWRELRRYTPLVFTPVGGLHHDADYVLRTFQVVQELPPFEQPTFVFTHVLSPHWPFVLDASCRLSRRGMRALKAERKALYADQIRCVNRQLLDLVRTLLARSRVPPIILLQSDHGGKWAHQFDDAASPATLSPDQARERFSTFGAYYLPGGGGRALGDSVTLVNVFPKVFNYYFGTDIPMQPDEYFTSVDGEDALVPVDRRLVDGDAAAHRTGAQSPPASRVPGVPTTGSSSAGAALPPALPRSASAR